MPELPEVETTRRGLASYIIGKRIEQVEVRRRDLRWPIGDGFEEILSGQRVTGLRRVGKYMIMDMDNGWSVLSHLGMSGTFRVVPTMPAELRKHDHVIIELESGEAVIYHDPRRFGFLLHCKTDEILQHPRLIDMGPDPFDEQNFTPEYLHAQLARRNAPIKAVLLDQSLVAGIGNIYASEALFGARIHPKRPANSLKKIEILMLISSITEVLAAAIASGGSTLRDYSGSDGEAGYFQHAFKVYGHANEPCSACKKLLKVETVAGRSSFFCENCQK